MVVQRHRWSTYDTDTCSLLLVVRSHRVHGGSRGVRRSRDGRGRRRQARAGVGSGRCDEEGGLQAGSSGCIADPPELADYDAILIGTPTRFGNMASQMKNFLAWLGGLWARDGLVGKVGSVFTSADSQHGGDESTILATHIVLLHLGMMVAGLPYTFKGQLVMDAPIGGSSYGASTLAGGGRQPSEKDLDGARFQGRYVTENREGAGPGTPSSRRDSGLRSSSK